MTRWIALAALALSVPGTARQTTRSEATVVDDVLLRLTSRTPAIREAAIAEVLAAPERVDPFTYAPLVGALWAEGRRRQAAFWFYVFQARTRPYADADEQGAGALRASLNDGLGTMINGWIASDLAAWQDTARRAIAYEAHLPPNGGPPDGMTAARWRALVAKDRHDYAQAFEQTLGGMDAAEVARQRRANGLYVGPLQDPGPPLPDDWR